MPQITQIKTATTQGGSYQVSITYNGLPPGPPASLSYNSATERYHAALSGEGTQTFTHTANDAGSHLLGLDPDELFCFDHTAAGLMATGGGVIIKTTKYPPPYTRPPEEQLNHLLLQDLEIKELKIERSGTGQNFTVSGVIGNKAGRNRSFSIHPNSAFIAGPNSRAQELLDIQIASSGNGSNKTFSYTMTNANNLSMLSPCCVILREAGTIDPSFDYSKSAWFYVEQ